MIKTGAASVAEIPNRRIRQECGSLICHRYGGRGAFRHAGGLLALPLRISSSSSRQAAFDSLPLLDGCNEETTHMAIAFLVIAAVTAIVYVASMLIEDLHDSSGE